MLHELRAEPNHDPQERMYLEQALQDLAEQKQRQRLKRLKSTRVIGTTCSATNFAILNENNLHYPIVLLDECSQMIETMSLMPIIRFKCERLLAVGDPNQVTVHTHTHAVSAVCVVLHGAGEHLPSCVYSCYGVDVYSCRQCCLAQIVPSVDQPVQQVLPLLHHLPLLPQLLSVPPSPPAPPLPLA